jgi:hypothetical protein
MKYSRIKSFLWNIFLLSYVVLPAYGAAIPLSPKHSSSSNSRSNNSDRKHVHHSFKTSACTTTIMTPRGTTTATSDDTITQHPTSTSSASNTTTTITTCRSMPRGGGGAAGATGATVSVPPIHQTNKTTSAWVDGLKSGLSSALAAACVKTLLQPVDAVKTMQQYYQTTAGGGGGGSTKASLSVVQACHKIWATGGLSKFYAGLGVVSALVSFVLGLLLSFCVVV